MTRKDSFGGFNPEVPVNTPMDYTLSTRAHDKYQG